MDDEKWAGENLLDRLRQFEQELRAAGLSDNTVNTYVGSETETVYPAGYDPTLWDLWNNNNDAAGFQQSWHGCELDPSVGDDIVDTAEVWPKGSATTVAGVGITINHDIFC